MGNTFDELNVTLSIRQFLWNTLSPYALPCLPATAVETETLHYSRLCYYSIAMREGIMGNPLVATDLAYHVRAQVDAVTGDYTGSWASSVGSEILNAMIDADYRKNGEGQMKLLDFKSTIDPLDFVLFQTTGDFSAIATALQAAEPAVIGSFWVKKWGEVRLELVDGWFDYGRTVVLNHCAPDVIRRR